MPQLKHRTPHFDGQQFADAVFTIPEFTFHRGGTLRNIRIAYRLRGAADGPLIWVAGGISANRQVFEAADGPGWWSNLVGHGCALDPREVRVLSFDWLGGVDGSTGATDTSFPVQEISIPRLIRYRICCILYILILKTSNI